MALALPPLSGTGVALGLLGLAIAAGLLWLRERP